MAKIPVATTTGRQIFKVLHCTKPPIQLWVHINKTSQNVPVTFKTYTVLINLKYIQCIAFFRLTSSFVTQLLEIIMFCALDCMTIKTEVINR